MSDPARAYVVDMLNAWYRAGDADNVGHHARVYRVHEPLEDALAGRVNNRDDDDGDEQSRDGVGDREAQPGAYQSDEGSKGGEAVDARVLPIGDQGDAVDAPADADLILRERFVAYDADQGGGHAEIELCGNVAAGQFLQRLNCSGDGASYDDQYDKYAGQVFGAIIAVGIALIGRSPGEDEGDPQCDGCEYVSRVVQCVGIESRAATDNGDRELHYGDKPHTERGDLHCPQADFVAIQVGIYLPVFMSMSAVSVTMIVVVVVIMIVVVMVVGMLLLIVVMHISLLMITDNSSCSLFQTPQRLRCFARGYVCVRENGLGPFSRTHT